MRPATSHLNEERPCLSCNLYPRSHGIGAEGAGRRAGVLGLCDVHSAVAVLERECACD